MHHYCTAFIEGRKVRISVSGRTLHKSPDTSSCPFRWRCETHPNLNLTLLKPVVSDSNVILCNSFGGWYESNDVDRPMCSDHSRRYWSTFECEKHCEISLTMLSTKYWLFWQIVMRTSILKTCISHHRRMVYIEFFNR